MRIFVSFVFLQKFRVTKGTKEHKGHEGFFLKKTLNLQPVRFSFINLLTGRLIKLDKENIENLVSEIPRFVRDNCST